MDKRGGAPGGSSMVSCEVLHSRGGENDTGGGECPPPCPPLNMALPVVDSCGSSDYWENPLKPNVLEQAFYPKMSVIMSPTLAGMTHRAPVAGDELMATQKS